MDVANVTRASARGWAADLTPAHWRILAASFMGWIFDGFESFALFLVVPMVLKSLLTPDQASMGAIWGGAAISITLLGWGIGGLIGGIMADYLGRKRMMMLSVLAYALLSGLTAFSTSFWMFAALRFLTGLAMGSEWSTGVALVAETWPDKARAKGCGFLQSGFGCGTLLAAGAWMVLQQFHPMGADTWRLMFVVGAIPAFFVLYIRRAVAESDKWLASVRERRWAATEGGTVSTQVKRPFTLAEIFREPESRKRALLTFLLSLATTVGWWGVSSFLPGHMLQLAKAAGVANPPLWGSSAALVYTAGAVVAYLLAGFLADAWGRRAFLLFTYAGCLLSTPLTYLWASTPQSLMVCAAINGFFTLGCAYSWMAIYPVELFTSSVRSTAASFIFNASRLIAWVFPLMAAAMIQTFGGLSAAAMTLGSIYLLGLIVPWFLPETVGRPLPD
ncbi:MFS transporter [Beijerinckia sp. L45]|uniref:MFS transporter n=1 Tax=Beijerinckia sp. L45 TaxID=1641855 RepID=UPI00131AA1F6|nr:MFS transporter [Beijerinckia sp. L45]